MGSKSSLSRPKGSTSLPTISDGVNGTSPPADPNAGHRERLRARFVKGGAAAMPDYELLELTLFAAVPRKDTKPLAKTLLARFGSFAEVIAAPGERLLEIPGVCY